MKYKYIAKYIAKTIATMVSVNMCIRWAEVTGGRSGIGWFIVSLLLIWDTP